MTTDIEWLKQVNALKEQRDKLIEIAEDAIRLADIDYENDKFGKVTMLREKLEEIQDELRGQSLNELTKQAQDLKMGYEL
jgi:hypothetical protein